MIKNECEIVKDLLPNYIENQISNETKEFVEEHLKNCNNCSEILKSIKGPDEIEKEEKEINGLKKYNRHMKILKIVVIILIAIIILMWGLLIRNYIQERKRYENAQNIYNVIAKAYLKIEEIQNTGNYKLQEEYTDIDGWATSRTIWYKDGRYKEEVENKQNEKIGYTNYGIIDETTGKDYSIQFGKEENMFGKGIEVYDLSISNYLGNTRNVLAIEYQKDISEYKNYSIKSETVDDKEYYVINIADGELWIGRYDNVLYEKYQGVGTTKYTWTQNCVTDEDIKMQEITFDLSEEEAYIVKAYNNY